MADKPEITDEQISYALNNEYDGDDKFLLVQEILELKAELATRADKQGINWISVKDGLPEKDVELLVFDGKGCWMCWFWGKA